MVGRCLVSREEFVDGLPSFTLLTVASRAQL